MILVFTICSNNYLAQALTLGNSLLKFNPDYQFIICLVDRKLPHFDYTKVPFEIIEVESLGLSYFDEMILKYDIVELNTSFKPSFFKHLFVKYNPESIIYLDPDIEVFAPFNELERELSTKDILITPHFTTPLNDDKWQAEEDFLNSGLFNLGFIALSNSENSKKMLDWWECKMRNKAFIDFKRGLFTDQIWINFVPLFYENVGIIRDKGYNVAYWNLHERLISEQNGKYYVNESVPLIFYHYASFRPLNPTKISTGQSRFTFENRPDILPLFQNYRKLLVDNYFDILGPSPCHFVQIKKNYEKEILQRKIKEIPLYKRAIGKILRIIIRKLNIVMDYSKL